MQDDLGSRSSRAGGTVSGLKASVFDVLDNAGIARDATAPVEHAVASLTSSPRAGSESTATTHPSTAVLATRCRVAAPPTNPSVTDRRVGGAEWRRVLVVDEISARWRSLRRVGRD